jgi:isocitrate dehydrogenase (NAD+)
MPKRITLIPGDGIGPEVTAAAVQLLEAAGADLEWEEVEAGLGVVSKYGKPLPNQVLESIRKNKVALKGPLTTAVATGFPSANVELRQKLKLYASLRPVSNVPGIESRFGEVDIIVVRENTEGLYSGLEHTITEGVTQSLKIITREASSRIAHFAFEYARKWNRKKVTTAHKANILKISDGLFLKTCQEVAREYPDILHEDIIVDNLALQLVINPQRFDVLLTTNLYGDIVSDLCAGLVGGLGLVPGANIGKEYTVFEAIHGSAPDIAGQNKANPLAVFFSSLLMLEYLQMEDTASRIREAIYRVTTKGAVLTPDLGGSASTTEFTEAVIRELE